MGRPEGPHDPVTQPAARQPWWLQLLVWALSLSVAHALLAAVVDGVLVGIRVSLLEAVGAALAAAVLMAWLLLAAAPILAGLAALTRLVEKSEGWWRRLYPLPGAGLAFVVAWALTQPLVRRLPEVYVLLCTLAAVALGVLIWLSRRRPLSLVAVAALLLVGFCVGLDIWVNTFQYRELHDLAQLVGSAGVVTATVPLRQRLRQVRPARLLVAAGLIAAMTAGWLLGCDRITPGWRLASLHHGRYATSAIRVMNRVGDRDGDGYSAIAWGGDCDDGDPAMHPLAADPPGGGDSNCNGVDPPEQPTFEHFGLAPARGSAALAPGTIDRVLLISVDGLRADALHPALTPNLSRLSQRSVRLTRCYAGGSGTDLSLPLLMKPTDDSESIAVTLRAHGVRAVTMLGAGHRLPQTGDQIRLGALRAAAATTKLLELIESTRQPLFVWMHLMDTHLPYVDHPGIEPPAEPEHLPRGYKGEVLYVDQQLARLLARLDERALWKRTAVVLTADHGEAMGEHGVLSHGVSGYDPVLRVPCWVYFPGLAAREAPLLASHRDLPATFLGLFGLADAARAAERFGRSWVRLGSAPEQPLHRFVISRSARFTSGRRTEGHLSVLVDERYKLVAAPEEGVFELFDLQRDPEENLNVAPQFPAVAQRLYRKLALATDLDGFPRRTPVRRYE